MTKVAPPSSPELKKVFQQQNWEMCGLILLSTHLQDQSRSL